MSALVQIVLDWPDSSLLPNRNMGRHWGVRHGAKTAAKEAALLQARQWRGVFPRDARLAAVIKLAPPDHRKRDVDNILAALKPSLDGMAQGLEIDDAQIFQTVIDRLDPVAGGSVTISIHIAR